MYRRVSLFSSLLLFTWLCAILDDSWAVVATVSNSSDSGAGSLRQAINTINATPATPNTINFNLGLAPIVLTSSLPPILVTFPNGSLTINGANTTIDGNNTSRAFFISAALRNVTIKNLQLNNTAGIGGAGGSNAAGNLAGGGGGGGALGAGGGLFIDAGGLIEINNVTFNHNSAEGGAGGSGGLYTGTGGGGGGAGGGGIYGGTGGAGGTHAVANDLSGGGGGGGGGCGIASLAGNGAVGGIGNTTTGGGNGGAGGNDFSGFNGGTGGPGHLNANGDPGGVGLNLFAGGGGGGGAASNPASPFSGGNGGGGFDFGGGGGSGSGSNTGVGIGLPGAPGQGGFGGGGGGSGTNQSGGPSGGIGGYGAGGGGGGQSGGGGTVFGGGAGAPGGTSPGGGGSGAALGGAIFVRLTGSLTITNTAGFPATSTVTAGTPGNGATSGIARGEEIFLGSGSSLIFSLNIPLTISTAIESDASLGGGGLTQNGPATLTLTGANTYSGSTTINGSVLQISSNSGLGTASNPVTLAGGTLELLPAYGTENSARAISLTSGGGTIQTDSGVLANSSGVLSGGGGDVFTKTGPGTLALLGVNTYMGNTVINGGVLQIANNGSLGSGTSLTFAGTTLELLPTFGTATLSQNVALNSGGGTIQTDSSSVVATFSGIFSGGAGNALTKIGTGTLVLSAANTYAGDTVINGGIVQISDDGNLGSGGSLVFGGGGTLELLTGFSPPTMGRAVTLNAGGGTIRTDTGVTVTFSSNFTGSGSFTKSGPGTLVLLNASSYTGGTIVSGGTLQGNTSSLQGAIQNNATLIFDQLGSGTYSGVLSGNGTLKTQGVGVLTFTAANTMTGTAEVVQATLFLNSSLPANFTVDAGAALQGFGPVASILNNGFVNPGSSSGTGVLSVTGNYVQGVGGHLDVNITGRTLSSDEIQAGGTASLSGTLEIFPDQGPYLKGTTYDIVAAGGGVSGTFNTVTFINSPTTFALHYLPNLVQLEVLNSTIFEGVTIHGHNAKQVAQYLQGLTYSNNSDLTSAVLDIAFLSNPTLSNALDQLHPAPNGAFEMVNSFQNSFISSLFTQHPLECCTVYACNPCGSFRHCDFWATPYLFRTNQDNSEGVAGFHTKSHGFATGFDYGYRSGWTVGGGIAYTYTEFSWNRRRGHGHIQGGILSLYSGFCRSHFDVEISLLGEINGYDISRTINFPGVARTAKSYHRGEGWTAHLGSGYEWCLRYFGIRPFINLDYSYLHQRKYREHGAQSLNLKVDQKNTKTLRSEVGLDFTGIYTWQHRGWVQPTLHLSWVGELPLYKGHYRATLVDAGGHFTVRSFHKMRNRFSPGASVTFAPHDVLAITFHYAAEISGQFLGQRGDIRIERRF